MKVKAVPVEFDYLPQFRAMQDVWNKGMENAETLAMLWPKLVAAAPSLHNDKAMCPSCGSEKAELELRVLTTCHDCGEQFLGELALEEPA